jgi:hypothetical protein
MLRLSNGFAKIGGVIACSLHFLIASASLLWGVSAWRKADAGVSQKPIRLIVPFHQGAK